MIFRTGKESLLGNAPPEDTRRERYIKEQMAKVESAGRSEAVADREKCVSRVKADIQAREKAAAKARAIERSPAGPGDGDYAALMEARNIDRGR